MHGTRDHELAAIPEGNCFSHLISYGLLFQYQIQADDDKMKITIKESNTLTLASNTGNSDFALAECLRYKVQNSDLPDLIGS